METKADAEDTGTLKKFVLEMFFLLILIFIFSKHKIRKYSLQEDPLWRVRAGSEAPSESSIRPSLDGEEAATMEEVDQDDLTSE